ncbi:hypothetical protein E3N88_07795 [Mikania micrantha]|uniref:Uncharacterized protein n=1 Tax=Mikania micrantha TaxID=192012 RepID=A0A5N6PEC4_9ASTR|nr:hypothetical protein E3N88_07795 [Mikania micrantha]
MLEVVVLSMWEHLQPKKAQALKACCTFRGSFYKLNATNGNILQRTYMLPDNNGSRSEYAGARIWRHRPSIDTHRNAIYIAIGNMYSAPLNVTKCQEGQNNQRTPSEEDR